MTVPSDGKHDTHSQVYQELPIEEQKKMAAEHPGKSWHDWFLEDFLRYSFWPIVLFESLFVASIISYLTGVSQFDPLLLGSTTALMLAVEYYYIYRRIWGSIRKKHNDDESDIAQGDIFDRIK